MVTVTLSKTSLLLGQQQTILGWFGVIDASAVLTEVTLRDVAVTGQRYTGSLVGFSNGTVRASHVNGNVTGTRDVGGCYWVLTRGPYLRHSVQ